MTTLEHNEMRIAPTREAVEARLAVSGERLKSEQEAAVDAYVDANRVSPWMALLLTILFGPIGYLYVSLVSGLILIALTIAGGLVIGLWVAPIAWIIAVGAAPFEAMSRNEQTRAKARLLALR